MTTKPTSRTIIRTAVLAVLAAMALLHASSLTGTRVFNINTSTGMTLAGAPLAIHGYDPVAYFTEGRARVGKAQFTATYSEAAYRFVNAANKAKFEKNPAKYAPQYGGYCAFGMALGGKFDGDPTLFRIVDQKLYFNLNPEIRDKWVQDIPGYIVTANNNWTKIQNTAPWELK